ncbi:enoyl-CoA hydratase/isomerase family protein [Paracoccus saliphilus]|uniref:Enoyl-CoA hydratase/isomerase family protein n=1 Tax=Paracoccus saliphilus TaxID=405559 RepID=A0AA45W230_9RHOB|nr:enoyl-CoA hydratase-related protein [Paracoccus saliphilus]WCR01815.1 enoyl-CoA hydratase/isomerase family protein [Paracoccus saliphilus]SIS63743.1 short chain enoyl-CoA hydratase /Enoyl-CoA hydratase [Paracoccus saliphilus]
MADQNGLKTRIEDGVLILTMDEPARRNPVGHSVRLAMARLLADAETDPEIRAVVLTGAGGNFSTGGDIKDPPATSIEASRERFAVVKDLIGRMTRFSKPLIAAVEGWAAGAGWSLALACDCIVAGESAQFLAPFRKIGLIPDLGMLATLPARIGSGRARQIMLDATPLPATEALRIGAVDHLVPEGQALTQAVEMARSAAGQAPLPRIFINDFLARSIDEALEYERQMQPILLRSEDAAEGRAAFFEKRQPQFRGK